MALADNLIAYWKLEEASGTRNDSHSNALHLTDNNTVTQATGKQGNAADFEASNGEYLSRVDSATLSMGDIDFTVLLWVNAESLGSNYVIGQYGGAGARSWEIQHTGSRFHFFVSNDGTVTNWVTANNLGAPSTATWYLIIAWHDAAANTINIQVNNGTVDSGGHTTGVFNSAEDFRIGTAEVGGPFWDGLIDEVAIWKRVLTSDERTQLYNGGSGMTYPFPVTEFASKLALLGVGA